MDKYIVIDGVKYEIDPNDKTKAKLDADGKPVPYVEQKPEEGKVDLSKVSIEELRKANPDVAKALQEAEDIKKRNADDDAKKAEADRKAKEEQGKWQELADEEKAKRVAIEGDLKKNTEVLEKYKGTVNSILENTLKGVPEEKLALIPKDYNPRKKLEYITENSKILGINMSPANKGGEVPPNEKDINLDEESKVMKEYDELLKKGKDRTQSENTKLIELAKKIKEIRLANASKK